MVKMPFRSGWVVGLLIFGMLGFRGSLCAQQVQVTLTWNALVDLDLHVVEPDGEEIYYGHPVSATGGALDRDSNPSCLLDGTNTEDIIWTTNAPAGVYNVFVDFYADCSLGGVNYTVTSRSSGQAQTNTGSFAAYHDDQDGFVSRTNVMQFTLANPGGGTVASLVPRFTSVSVVGSNVQVGFTTSNAVSYVFENTTDPVNGIWLPVLGFTGTGGLLTFIDPNAAALPQRFYRIATALPALMSGADILCVATNGSDGNPGTVAAPFATLTRAQTAVQQKIASGLTNNVLVLIGGGTYELAAPLVFGPADSGTSQYSITYQAADGQVPILSGGARITGWEPQGTSGIWTTAVAAVEQGQWYFRHLYVNGQRAVRARTPNIDSTQPYDTLANAAYSLGSQSWQLTMSAGQVTNWNNLSDVEVVSLGVWQVIRKTIQSVSVASNTVVLAPPDGAVAAVNMPQNGSMFYLENALEMLDEPGEWYLDRHTGVLSYWPRPGEDMTSADVVAPALTQLVLISGTSAQPVQNLHFNGILFGYTDWPLPSVGYLGAGAAIYYASGYDVNPQNLGVIPAAIDWQYAKSCSIESGQIAHTGGTAIWLGTGCASNSIVRNSIFDIAAEGVMVGDTSNPTNGADWVYGNLVANNQIDSCGSDFCGVAGICSVFAANTIISHNLLFNLPYTGISIGNGLLGTNQTCVSTNLVEYNVVYDAMNTLADAGAIYTLGYQPGTLVWGNVIHDIRKNSLSTPYYNQCGIYLDDGSKAILIESNIVYRSDTLISNNSSIQSNWDTYVNNLTSLAPNAPGFAKVTAAQAGPAPSYMKLFQQPASW